MLRSRLSRQVRLVGLGRAHGPRVSSETLGKLYTSRLDKLCPGHGQAKFAEQMFAQGPKARSLVLDPAEDRSKDPVEKIYADAADHLIRLSSQASKEAIQAVGCPTSDYRGAVFVSEVPNCAPLNTRLWRTVGLQLDVRSRDVIGTGCLGGVQGLLSGIDLATMDPLGLVLVSYGETLASRSPHLVPRDQQPELLARLKKDPKDKDALYWQRSGAVIESILGDGFIAAVLAGEQHPAFWSLPWSAGPVILDSIEETIPDTEHLAWVKPNHTGVRMHLSPQVPDTAPCAVAMIKKLLARNGLSPADIDLWLPHNGGVKVLNKIEQELGLRHKQELKFSWQEFEECGNSLSVGVIGVLKRAMESGEACPGDLIVMVSFGPGMRASAILAKLPPVDCRTRCEAEQKALDMAH